VIAIIWISCQLYLRSRTILRCNTNFSVIASAVLGPSSSILLNSLVVFAVFGILALYMILFSDIAISLVGSSYPEDHLFSGKAFYVCSLCLLISPIVIRKTIQELKLSTYILFFGIISLCVMLTILLVANGSYEERLAAGQIDLEKIAQMKAASGTK